MLYLGAVACGISLKEHNVYFKNLPGIIPYIDDAFEAFYNVILKEKRFAVFFAGNEQIRRLIELQKRYFITSLSMPLSQIRDTYIALGEQHHQMKIPYVDFAKGTEILQEHFILESTRNAMPEALIGETFEYFKMIRAYTAKGYLNRMLEEDKHDIGLFNERLAEADQSLMPVKIMLNKITWLSGLLDAIRNDSDWSEETERYFAIWQAELHLLPQDKRTFFKAMEERIRLDTKSLFYFLKKQEYTEILPLYGSLLKIYKLALVMHNALTIEYANRAIDEMKLDQRTLLYRKDQFESSMCREMEQAQRDPLYRVSAALIDIDDFKHVNDHFGHFNGDKVLESLGEIIRRYTRKRSDLGFRIGGDEIAIIFKNASTADAKRTCEKIRARMQAYDFPFEEQTFDVTLSIGVKTYDPREDKGFERFFNALDRQLYHAKKGGKNRVFV